MNHKLDLFFELSNEDRLRILTTLQDGPSKLTQLSNRLDLPNQEVSRHLARLVTLDLCYRDGEGSYRLTPYAEHAIKLTSGYEFISKNRAYFKTHTAMNLPTQFQLRIGELSSCVSISDPMTNLSDIRDMADRASEHIWYMVEQGNMTLAKALEDAIVRGVDYRVLMPHDVKPSEPYAQYIKSWTPNHPLRSEKVERRYLERLPVGLAVSEESAPQILFPTTEGKLDYSGFKAIEKVALNWCKDLFRYYWEIGSKTMPSRFRDLLE